LLGQKKYSELPAYCKGFDVAMLPFKVNALTVAANPLKLREYLAAGLPVVATAIPEAERLQSLIRTALTPPEFLSQIDSILASGRSGPSIEISRAMDSESWDDKVRQMIALASPYIPPAKARSAAHPAAAEMQEICSENP
jgi:hypothetical protein